MKKRIRLQGMLIFLVIIPTLILSKVVFGHWQQESLDGFMNALGIALILFGFLFRIAARGYKAEVSQGGGKLITDGPYKIIRNPMYSGTFLIGSGIVLAILAWWTFFVFLAVFAFIYTIQTRKEETLLLNRFGDEYRRYCKITPKYFPHFSSLFSKDIRNYIFLRPRWVKKELPSLIVVIIMVIIFGDWEEIKLFSYSGLLKAALELFLIALAAITSALLFIRKEDGCV